MTVTDWSRRAGGGGGWGWARIRWIGSNMKAEVGGLDIWMIPRLSTGYRKAIRVNQKKIIGGPE